MLEYFKFKQLEGFSEEKAQAVIAEAKRDAYGNASYWLRAVLFSLLAVVVGVVLMQLPRLLNIHETTLGLLIHGGSILVAVILYYSVMKRVFSRYILNHIGEPEA